MNFFLSVFSRCCFIVFSYYLQESCCHPDFCSPVYYVAKFLMLLLWFSLYHWFWAFELWCALVLYFSCFLCLGFIEPLRSVSLFLPNLGKFWSFFQIFFLSFSLLTGTQITCIRGCLTLTQNPLICILSYYYYCFSFCISFWIISVGAHSSPPIYIFCVSIWHAQCFF